VTERICFDDLRPYLLLQNGNFLYKVPYRDGWAVLKIYYGSRGRAARLRKSIGNWTAGQTSYLPRTRCRIEKECLALWRRHGLRVFDVLDVEVEAPGCVPGGYLLLEYVSAPKLGEFIRDESRPVEERMEMWRRFLPEWGHRHELAIRHREPRLVHENGDCKHVMLVDQGFLWFDFEMVYRHASRVELHVSHEIVQYLWQLLRGLPQDLKDRVLDETVKGYPAPERLVAASDYFLENPSPVRRVGRAVERRFRARAQKPTSKYHVAERLRERLQWR